MRFKEEPLSAQFQWISRMMFPGMVLLTMTLFGGQPPSFFKATASPAPPPGAAQPGVQLPPVVGQDWWSRVQVDIQKEEYNITWQERTALPDGKAAYQAPNRAQGFRTTFTEESILVAPMREEGQSWTWGLSLVALPAAGSR